MYDLARLTGRLALLAALPALAACGTFRAYEGPERPPEEVARIEEDVDTLGLVPLDYTSAEIVAVDGVSIADHSGSTVGVLPGAHTLEVKGTLRMPAAGILEHPHGRIAFDARAGGKYEFGVGLPGKGGHTTSIIILFDSDSGTALGDTSPAVELAHSAIFDFGGPPWPVADWGRTDALANMTWLPPGQTLDDWQEMIEAQAYLPADPNSIEDPVNHHILVATKQWEESDPPITWSERPTARDWRLLEYHGSAGEGRPEEHGIVLLTGAEGRVHLLVYATRSEATLQANAARWEAAFEGAKLELPTY